MRVVKTLKYRRRDRVRMQERNRESERERTRVRKSERHEEINKSRWSLWTIGNSSKASSGGLAGYERKKEATPASEKKSGQKLKLWKENSESKKAILFHV